ncbi:uncharacterized protein YbcI [Evansella vedderi]|uniref:Uncharacterized protein YbcI n=1 Tax=Evansella vedderi TaxID=38282 RepID=A0ABU0A0D4_9BACI|nr:Na-translocating system protein MpsC family protein [Evansella vedderi]MDQ0256953.1 uncharacterized protein YbcI [Evansella vedderi]
MIKEKKDQEDLIYISSQLSKLLKKSFGKGPDSCFSILHQNMLFVNLRQFTTPAEEVLLFKKEKSFALKFRSIILQSVFEKFKPEMKKTLSLEFDSFFHDWNYDTNSGFILFTKKTKTANQTGKLDRLKNQYLEESIFNCYSETYKTPQSIDLWKINNNLIMAKCHDILLPIEKELFRQGHYELLYNHLVEIKYSIIEHKRNFSFSLDREIIDMFLVWDYDLNNNYLILYLK